MEPRLIIALGIILLTVLLAAGFFAYRAHIARQRRQARRLQRQLEAAVEARAAAAAPTESKVHPWLEERPEREPRVHPWIEPR